MIRVQEKHFLHFPKWASHLYDFLTQAETVQIQTDQFARLLCSQLSRGKLLDVGSGPGRLLQRIHTLNPELELYGLDISPAMIDRAMKNLAETPVHLMVGSIEQAPWEDGMFDMVTCSGSLYLWARPRACLDEIWRVLKPLGHAYLLEIRGDVDLAVLKEALRRQLKRESLWRRFLAPLPIRKAISQSYGFDTLSALLRDTSFGTSSSIESVEFAGLPLWYLVKLQKV